MNAREYLAQLETIETRIHCIQYDIKQLKDLALSITPAYDGERVQASGNNQRMATVVDKYADKERELEAERDRLIDKRLEISRTIRCLKQPNEIDVLQMLYIEKKSYEDIAAACSRSVSWVKSMHGWALLSLQKELDARN